MKKNYYHDSVGSSTFIYCQNKLDLFSSFVFVCACLLKNKSFALLFPLHFLLQMFIQGKEKNGF